MSTCSFHTSSAHLARNEEVIGIAEVRIQADCLSIMSRHVSGTLVTTGLKGRRTACFSSCTSIGLCENARQDKSRLLERPAGSGPLTGRQERREAAVDLGQCGLSVRCLMA